MGILRRCKHDCSHLAWLLCSDLIFSIPEDRSRELAPFFDSPFISGSPRQTGTYTLLLLSSTTVLAVGVVRSQPWLTLGLICSCDFSVLIIYLFFACPCCPHREEFACQAPAPPPPQGRTQFPVVVKAQFSPMMGSQYHVLPPPETMWSHWIKRCQ